ncbi:hypothetical protein DAMA08_026940 [Martiniozyma asiatica (nom. inval.)]|nr:hypothetical protein DAMA08_026940 [Martiniozyma asiatica]
MVHIDPNDPNKLNFRLLNDPNDNLMESFYKHFFRYASPELFLWGPLAPAHDALAARAILSEVQLGVGVFLFLGSFKKFPSNVPRWRRNFTKAGCVLAGSSLIVGARSELENVRNPERNPLYIEIQLARQMGSFENRESYYFGPDNFMPMNNKDYWSMIFDLTMKHSLALKYNQSSLMQKYQNLLDRKFGWYDEEYESNNKDVNFQVSNEKELGLSQRIKDIAQDKFIITPANSDFRPPKLLKGTDTDSVLNLLSTENMLSFYNYKFPRFNSRNDKE